MRTARQVLDHLLDCSVRGDWDELAELYAPDVVIEIPFAPPGVPPITRGRAEFQARLRAFAEARPYRFDSADPVLVHDTDDPEVIVAEYQLNGRVLATDLPFAPRYLMVITVRDGLIVRSRDYAEMLTSARATGRLPQLLAALTERGIVVGEPAATVQPPDSTPGKLVAEMNAAAAERGQRGFADLLTEDAVLEYPFAPPGMPGRIDGRDGFRAYLAQSGHASALAIEESRTIAAYQTADPDVLVCEQELLGVVVDSGRPFRLRSVGVLRARDGRIAGYRDYFNPVALAQTTGLLPELFAALE